MFLRSWILTKRTAHEVDCEIDEKSCEIAGANGALMYTTGRQFVQTARLLEADGTANPRRAGYRLDSVYRAR